MSTLELARSAAIADAGNPELVGADVSVEIDDDGRVETYLFEAHLVICACNLLLGLVLLPTYLNLFVISPNFVPALPNVFLKDDI